MVTKVLIDAEKTPSTIKSEAQPEIQTDLCILTGFLPIYRVSSTIPTGPTAR